MEIKPENFHSDESMDEIEKDLISEVDIHSHHKLDDKEYIQFDT